MLREVAFKLVNRLAAGCRLGWALAALVFTVAEPCAAQIPISLHVDPVFYADDTEFANPFRPGGTILGSFQRIFVEIEPSDRATLQLGLYAMERAGSHSPVDRGLPIVSLRLGSPRQQFILGTLRPPSDHREAFGPDRTTPHGLLPPLGVETLWFTRAYEAGVQWVTRTERVAHDVWFDYQTLNTPEHREHFDAGAVGRLAIAGPFALGYQAHIVHHGGEQYQSGPVADSFGYGPGLMVERPLARLDAVSLEVFGLVADDRPDRAAPLRTVEGKGVFVRAAAEKRRWRGHVIVWRGDDFNHEDGDPNYLSKDRSGMRYHGTRDYSELGLARLFRPAPAVDLEGSVRMHRIEAHFGYSFRLLAIVHLTLWRASLDVSRARVGPCSSRCRQNDRLPPAALSLW